MLVHQKDDVIKKLQLQLLSLNNVAGGGVAFGIVGGVAVVVFW